MGLRPHPFTMQIHLRHPKHGVKTTSVETEAKWDEKHGWIRYTLQSAETILAPKAISVYNVLTPQAASLEGKPKGSK